MEEIYKAIVLGIIQGLTEYLPISSTAHLRIIPSFFGWNDIGAAYTAVIQVGTMIAIIIYFWKDLTNMLSSAISSIREKNYRKPDTYLLFLILAGTLPILIFGYLLKDFIRNEFRNMYLVSASIIFFSVVLYLSEKYSKQIVTIEKLTIKDSLFIGFFQSLALIPGASRSGSTIAGGFFRNMQREGAARFAFLLSIPAVFFSGIYELYSERKILFSGGDSGLGLFVATVISGAVGYASIWFMLSYLKTHSLKLFIIYRIVFGVLILILLNFKIISN
ncbi:MAG: undecaprenyl-diphosphatase UppP [Ignavibacteria bacterium]